MEYRISLPIQTDQLQLRDFVASNFEAVYAYASDPEVTQHMFYGPRDEADTRAYLARMLASQDQRPRMRWELAVIERASHSMIGACDLTLDNEHEGDLGFILGRGGWGKGYATEAARAMVKAGFEELKLERIYGICEVGHQGSSRVLKKAGLGWAKMVLRYEEAKGRWWGMDVYELRRDQWAQTHEPATAGKLPN